MPYTTPPTFADDAVLAASQLNTLSDDVEFLHGLLTGVNNPFRSIGIAGGDGDEVGAGDHVWYIRHLGRYLHYKMELTSGTHDEFQIYYDDVVIYADMGNASAPHTWEGSIDLHDTGILPSTPTIGEFYGMTFQFKFDADSSGGLLHYLLESDSDTL